jgi:hypothetical protein
MCSHSLRMGVMSERCEGGGPTFPNVGERMVPSVMSVEAVLLWCLTWQLFNHLNSNLYLNI